MSDIHELMNYYVSVDDGDHMFIVSNNDHIFEALCSYYQTIDEGPNDGVSTSRWLEVEMGETIFTGKYEEIEPLLYHEFPETN